MVGWEHEKLPIYAKVRPVVAELSRLSWDLRAVRPDLTKQLARSSASIALNLAEGAGEFRAAEKARFYRFARRSAAECAATLDVIEDLPTKVDVPIGIKDRLYDISAELTRLAKAFD